MKLAFLCRQSFSLRKPLSLLAPRRVSPGETSLAGEERGCFGRPSLIRFKWLFGFFGVEKKRNEIFSEIYIYEFQLCQYLVQRVTLVWTLARNFR